MLTRTAIAIFCSIAVILGTPLPAAAQLKTDVVTLRNGDRITGEVVSVSRGRLRFKTDDVGTIDIEWDKVVRLEAVGLFEVETSSGRRLLGNLSGGTTRVLNVVTVDGSVPLAMDAVTSVTPLGKTFWSRLEGSMNGGFSYTHSSGIAQATVSADTTYRRLESKFLISGSATLTEDRDGTDDDDDRAALSFSYIRYRGPRWFFALAGTFESNKSLGLVLRSQGGGAIGQRLVNTNRAQFEVGGGLVGNNEKSVDLTTQQNIEGLLGSRFSYYTYDGPKTTIDAAIQYYPSLNQWGRQRIQSDASFRRDVLKDMPVGVSLYYTFDSNPPQQGAQRTDVGLMITVGWTFGR